MAKPGDVVLLSPACAARTDLVAADDRYDVFSSADERGDRFSELVKAFAAPVAR
jgi:UDP-N-acetylmuramoylalanine-D-glutamate ligase